MKEQEKNKKEQKKSEEIMDGRAKCLQTGV